jgi:histidinol phosphatase-like PHP family hydrolase
MERKQALKTLKKAGYELRNMPQYMGDKELVLAAVKDYGLALKQATPELQNNRQIVMAAVKNNGMAIDFASPALQKDKVIMKVAKAQEQGLEDAMNKKYSIKKGGRKRTRRL